MVHYLNFKDGKYRKILVKNEFFKNISFSCLLDLRVSFKSRFLFKSKLCDRVLFLSGVSISKVRKRCKETGRSRFVVSYVGLSRAQFKRKASLGLLSSLRKK
jgi:ribosomal protein S14